MDKDEILIGDGWDFGLYAIMLSVSAASYIFKAIFMKQKRDIVLSMIFTLATLIFSIAHIYILITTYGIVG